MSVQIELPPGSRTVVVSSVNTPSRKVVTSRRPSIPRCLPGLVTAIAGCKRRSNQDSMLADETIKQQKPLPSRQHSSHSHSAAATTTVSAVAALRRESLTLTLNRSISEPHAPGVAGIPAGNGASGIDPPVLSPPSASPSLHPSKRCRVEQVRIMAPPAAVPAPASSAGPSCFLRPPISIAGTVSLPASPCSESSTLQRTLLLQRARTITHERFAARLEAKGNNNNGESDFLLVDCRPFIAFNVNHIRGAINVNCCDRFNRKRLQQGKATLADLATTKEGKETLKRRNWREVIVYDDCSDSLETLPVSHTLFLVMNALAEDHREPVMLLGGLRDFQVAHREMCADHLMRGGPPSVQSPTSPLILNHQAPQSPIPELCNRTKDIENHPATQVLPYLYLGNMRDAADSGVLRRLGVKYVLNVTAKPPDYKFEPGIVYKQLEAADNGIQNLRQFFEEAFAFIDLARRDRSGVLIHCHAGVSRSPTIAVAYLMKRFFPFSMGDAYKFVKTRRSIISPNLNFMGQLWEFEQGLRTEKEAGNLSNKPDDGDDIDDMEMREVRESLASSSEESALSSSSSSTDSNGSGGEWSSTTPSATALTAPPSASPFRWAERQQQQKSKEASQTGCSV